MALSLITERKHEIKVAGNADTPEVTNEGKCIEKAELSPEAGTKMYFKLETRNEETVKKTWTHCHTAVSFLVLVIIARLQVRNLMPTTMGSSVGHHFVYATATTHLSLEAGDASSEKPETNLTTKSSLQ